jgi:hypothetical protein
VQDGVIVSQLFASNLQVDVFLLVELHDRLLEIFDARVLDALGNELGTRNKVLGHGIQRGKCGILSAAQLVQGLLLDRDTKVVSVLDTRDIQLDPDLDDTAVLNELQRVRFDDGKEGEDILKRTIYRGKNMNEIVLSEIFEREAAGAKERNQSRLC